MPNLPTNNNLTLSSQMVDPYMGDKFLSYIESITMTS